MKIKMIRSVFSKAACGLLASALFLSGCAGQADGTGFSQGQNKAPVSASDFLLNTFVTITLYDTDDTTILDHCMAICKDYENLFSKTIETSEIYKLNHRPPDQQTFTLSGDTAALLKKGLEYCEMSDGAFDITIEPLSSLWDFTGEEHVIPPVEEIEKDLKKVGYQNLKLEGNRLTFLSPDTTIDLGGIAKGYIADRIRDYLVEAGVRSALINLGGNVLCVGERTDGSPFQVGLQKPFAAYRETFETVRVSDMSVVVSGVYERHFIIDGKNYHHILNPATGYPYDNGLVSVAILSEDSVDGDGLSTTCFSLGLDGGLKLADSLDGVYAVFITGDYEVYYSEGTEAFLAGK